MENSDQQFPAWEQFIKTHSLRIRKKHSRGAKRDEDGFGEIEAISSSSVRVDQLKLEEEWAQRYVATEFKQLGFAKIRGPYRQGPDFEVLHKRTWKYAEVERHWQNYCNIGITKIQTSMKSSS